MNSFGLVWQQVEKSAVTPSI